MGKKIVLSLGLVIFKLTIFGHVIYAGEKESKSVITFYSDSDLKLEEDYVVNEKVSVISSSSSRLIISDLINYEVKKNQTLMIIAFELYGDYTKWREVYNLNKEKLKFNTKLPLGIKLKVPRPLKKYKRPEGDPYLVKRGDSLSIISRKVYGYWQNWPEIFDNNRDMIRHPNLIFAGFTLYYKPVSRLALKLY